MNRRAFFGSLVALALAPRIECMPLPAPAITGIQGWLPTGYEPPMFAVDRSVTSRIECIMAWHEQGFISSGEAFKLLDIPALD